MLDTGLVIEQWYYEWNFFNSLTVEYLKCKVQDDLGQSLFTQTLVLKKANQ